MEFKFKLCNLTGVAVIGQLLVVLAFTLKGLKLIIFQAIKLQPVLNELMHRVSHDRAFLTETLSHTIKVDDFTGRLFKIYEQVWDEGLVQVRKA